jgi:hypothetical protein
VITNSQALSGVFGVASGVAAAVAAYFWWRSSRVEIPAILHGSSSIGGNTYVVTEPLASAARESGRLNSIAASWSAIAAVAAAISSVAGIVSNL